MKLTLVWGQGANDHQTLALTALPGTYKEMPFTFTAGADTENGGIEIIGIGRG